MKWFIRLALVGFITSLATGALAQESGGFKVIVHPSNPQASITKSDLARLFFKKSTSWDHGARASPVDLKSSSRVRATFSKEAFVRWVTRPAPPSAIEASSSEPTR